MPPNRNYLFSNLELILAICDMLTVYSQEHPPCDHWVFLVRDFFTMSVIYPPRRLVLHRFNL
jgi:hypothetical protein